MADQIMWLPQHFRLVKTADFRKGPVCLGNISLSVGSGINENTIWNNGFLLGDWLIVTHFL
ncbi:hypothetical protein [Aquitalea magnusonii]|uniref:hypothetical protein n=1 Tax=Aquitalea magnusonii TaxID=332411 RepID=UPI001E3FB20B|nr:hypothetical protein [Aquitalea magnusonii]